MGWKKQTTEISRRSTPIKGTIKTEDRIQNTSSSVLICGFCVDLRLLFFFHFTGLA
jgi:hypothetical protein